MNEEGEGLVADETSLRPTGRILVVEDDASLRSLLTRAMGAEGYETTAATTAAEALEEISGRLFDVVLLDVRLPDGDASRSATRGSRSSS